MMGKSNRMMGKRILSAILTAAVVIGLAAFRSPAAHADELYDSDSPVPSFSSIEVIDGGVRFSWEPYQNENCPDGVFYRVYYRNYYGSWVSMITTASTHFVDTDVHPGISFDYTIRCVTPDGSAFASDFNDDGWNAAYYDAPALEPLSSKTPFRVLTGNFASGSLLRLYKGDLAATGSDPIRPAMRTDTVKWTGDAPAYRVYRRTLHAPSEYEVLCESTTALSYTRTYYEEDTVYAYKVCALDNNGEVASACAVTPYYVNGSVYNSCGRWLYELMSAADEDFAQMDYADMTDSELHTAAREHGAVRFSDVFSVTDNLTRQFTADTLVNLFGYKAHSLANYYNTSNDNPLDFTITDDNHYYAADTTNKNINTAAYYGWIETDSRNCLYPSKDITADEWDNMMTELSLYRQWNGKTLISFGDSGIHGRGNIVADNDGDRETTWRDSSREDFTNKRFPRFNVEKMEGPAEFIGEKYGMIHRDYSWAGSSMGTELVRVGSTYRFDDYAAYKTHIANQIRTAVKEKQDADLIIMNGGDNDELYDSIPFDTLSGRRSVYDWGYSAPEWFSEPDQRDFQARNPQYFHYNDRKSTENYTNETTFIGGCQTAFSLIEDHFDSVPTIYVRSHQIDYGSLLRQRIYQEEVMSIAEDYGLTTVDLFNNTDLDGLNKRLVTRYCYDGVYEDGTDDNTGTHPNGLGYSKYYLPFIENAMSDL